MTAHREEGLIYFTCDYCGECIDTGTREFSDAVDYKKDYGWVSRKDPFGGWNDVCDICIEELES